MLHGNTFPDNPLEGAASGVREVVARIGCALHVAEGKVVVKREVQILADIRGDFQSGGNAATDALRLEFRTTQFARSICCHIFLNTGIDIVSAVEIHIDVTHDEVKGKAIGQARRKVISVIAQVHRTGYLRALHQFKPFELVAALLVEGDGKRVHRCPRVDNSRHRADRIVHHTTTQVELQVGSLLHIAVDKAGIDVVALLLSKVGVTSGKRQRIGVIDALLQLVDARCRRTAAVEYVQAVAAVDGPLEHPHRHEVIVNL